MTKDEIDQALGAWSELNKALKEADERTCMQLLKVEVKYKRRRQFMLRIHSRLNKARADRERYELTRAQTGARVLWVERWR